MARAYEKYSGRELQVAERIQRLRSQLLVNANKYFIHKDTNVPDWKPLAEELHHLLMVWVGIYADPDLDWYNEFRHWNFTDWADLPYDNPKVNFIVARLYAAKQVKTVPDKPVKEVKKRGSGAKRKLF